jgi:hypothetical protein
MGIESIGSVLKKKGREICAVAPGATVYEAVALMAAKGVAAVLVIAEGRYWRAAGLRELFRWATW